MMFSYAPRIAHFFECSSLSFKRRRRPSIQSGWCPFKKLNSHKRTYACVVVLGSPRERPLISTRAVHTDRVQTKSCVSFARSDPRARDSSFASSSSSFVESRPKIARRRDEFSGTRQRSLSLCWFFCLDFSLAEKKQKKRKKKVLYFRV